MDNEGTRNICKEYVQSIKEICKTTIDMAGNISDTGTVNNKLLSTKRNYYKLKLYSAFDNNEIIWKVLSDMLQGKLNKKTIIEKLTANDEVQPDRNVICNQSHYFFYN